MPRFCRITPWIPSHNPLVEYVSNLHKKAVLWLVTDKSQVFHLPFDICNTLQRKSWLPIFQIILHPGFWQKGLNLSSLSHLAAFYGTQLPWNFLYKSVSHSLIYVWAPGTHSGVSTGPCPSPMLHTQDYNYLLSCLSSPIPVHFWKPQHWA